MGVAARFGNLKYIIRLHKIKASLPGLLFCVIKTELSAG